MKAVAINGSPRKGGNTEQMLNIVLDTIKKSGIETKLIQIGGTNIHGCRGCWACAKIKNGKCAFNDDILNELLDEVYSADALILGTPSYFADMTPELKAFIGLDKNPKVKKWGSETLSIPYSDKTRGRRSSLVYSRFIF